MTFGALGNMSGVIAMPRRVAVILLLFSSLKDIERQISQSGIMIGNLVSVFDPLKINQSIKTLEVYH